MKRRGNLNISLKAILMGSSVVILMPAHAAVTTDRNGNVGYSTAAECDEAVTSGKAKFYEPFTDHEPLKRAGEVNVKQGKLSDVGSEYSRGACDIGVGRSQERDGVSRTLIGKYVPFSPSLPVNIYTDA